MKYKYRVAAYLRLSKEEFSNEKESNSITNQKLIINNYLKEHREHKLVDYYIDDGYSGTNFDRPELQGMLEDIKNKKMNEDTKGLPSTSINCERHVFAKPLATPYK